VAAGRRGGGVTEAREAAGEPEPASGMPEGGEDADLPLGIPPDDEDADRERPGFPEGDIDTAG
jgi:hypothetical protein